MVSARGKLFVSFLSYHYVRASFFGILRPSRSTPEAKRREQVAYHPGVLPGVCHFEGIGLRSGGFKPPSASSARLRSTSYPYGYPCGMTRRTECFWLPQVAYHPGVLPGVCHSEGTGLRSRRLSRSIPEAKRRGQVATLAPHCVRCTPALAGGARGAGVGQFGEIAEHIVPVWVSLWDDSPNRVFLAASSSHMPLTCTARKCRCRRHWPSE